MDAATARARLEMMVQYNVAPTLSSAEIDVLMLMARRTDADGYAPYDIWATSTIYTVYQYRVPVVSNGRIYQVTTAGTSGASEPTWPTTSGATVTDGTVVWTDRGLYLWTPTYDLKAAAAAGWEWKAGKVAAKFDLAAGDVKVSLSQQFQQCMAMAKRFRGGGGLGSVRLAVSHSRYS